MRQFIAVLFLATTLLAQNVVSSNGGIASNGGVSSQLSFTYGPNANLAGIPDDSAYTPVANTCGQTLAAGGSYKLTGDLTCSIGTVALTLGGLNTKFSGHGFTIQGRLINNVNPNGNEVFWVNVHCNYPDGADWGCLLLDNSFTSTLTNTIKVHHTKVWNEAANLGNATKRSAFINLSGTSANNPDVEVYNNYFYADAVGNKDSFRVIVFEANGAPNIWIHNNQAKCGSEESTCQGLIAYGSTGTVKEYNNYVSEPNLVCAGGCGDDGRMLGCDATNSCFIYNNICDGVFGRCLRFRGVADGHFYDNLLINSGLGRSGTGILQLGDNDNLSAGTSTVTKTGTSVSVSNTTSIPYKTGWRIEATLCSDTNANIANAIITKTGTSTFTYNVATGGNSSPTGCAFSVAESNCVNEVYNNTFSVDTDGTRLIFFRGIDCVSVHDNNIKTTLANALTTGDNWLSVLRVNTPATTGTFFRNYGATSIQSNGSGGYCGVTHNQICLEANSTITVTTCKTGTAIGGGTITTSTGC